MNKLVFLFLCILYISVSILSFSGSFDIENQLIISGAVIILFGIPHGAIDHILFMKKSNISHLLFFSIYLSFMAAYLVLWYIFPVVALILFLFLSAYHFGESQLSSIITTIDFKKFIYSIWGLNILSALIVYNHLEIHSLFELYTDLNVLLPVFDLSFNKIILVTSSITLASAACYCIYHKRVDIETIIRELFTLTIIHISFLLLPVLVGFTLYFTILHSLKVLDDEFKYLAKVTRGLTINAFIKKLIPFTLLSIIGGFGTVLLVHFEFINISYVLLSLVLISILTLPHALVMYRFYQTNLN